MKLEGELPQNRGIAMEDDQILIIETQKNKEKETPTSTARIKLHRPQCSWVGSSPIENSGVQPNRKSRQITTGTTSCCLYPKRQYLFVVWFGLMGGIMQAPYDTTVKLMLASLERNLLPDAVIRRLTRLLLATRLRSAYKPSSQLQLSDLIQFAHSLREMPIAVDTDKPKSQHYELPTSFFRLVLGKNLKYSCCYFSSASETLEDAEEAMLELYCERSNVKDGHTVLDVGCGWGSLALYIAKKYSNCRVTGICNSTTQKAFIEEQCRDLQLQNLDIIVADISTFEMEATYDRIFSIEMFEHMKNYRDLLKKISKWMKDDSLLFVHHFCHKAFAYHFEDKNEDDWITRYFFTGGTMLSANLLLYFQDDVSVVNHWQVNGKHYAQTSEEWLKRMDRSMSSIKPIMESTYGKESATKWTAYWRTFFIAVAELFGYNNGEEWMVAHFLFKKK